MEQSLLPVTVYGSDLSYFTGKLEMYFRLKGIDYRFEPMGARIRAEIGRQTGTTQMPAARLADGRWMSDTTPMIAWFEEQQPAPPLALGSGRRLSLPSPLAPGNGGRPLTSPCAVALPSLAATVYTLRAAVRTTPILRWRTA